MSLDGDRCEDSGGTSVKTNPNGDVPFLDPMCLDYPTVLSDSGAMTKSPETSIISASSPQQHSDDVLAHLPKMKPPLKHKSSDLSNDSGRSSSGDPYDSLPQTIVPVVVPFVSEDVSLDRRHSTADNTGHLAVPGGTTCTVMQPDAAFENSDSVCDGSNSKNAQHAPRIMFSHSMDRLLPNPQRIGERRKSSPRLRRQPTRETQHLFISDGTGFVQLNQYKLKDEVGKVRS